MLLAGLVFWYRVLAVVPRCLGVIGPNFGPKLPVAMSMIEVLAAPIALVSPRAKRRSCTRRLPSTRSFPVPLSPGSDR